MFQPTAELDVPVPLRMERPKRVVVPLAVTERAEFVDVAQEEREEVAR